MAITHHCTASIFVEDEYKTPYPIDEPSRTYYCYIRLQAFSTRSTFEPDFLPEDCEELVEQDAVVVVGQDLLLRALVLLHVDHAHLQLGLDEDLAKKFIHIRETCKNQLSIQCCMSKMSFRLNHCYVLPQTSWNCCSDVP